MLFSIGVELPKSAEQAFGIVVPALCKGDHACYSAADSEDQLAAMANDAIITMVEEMLADGLVLTDICDDGVLSYRQQPEHSDVDTWLLLDIDMTKFEGKPKRINISIPDILIQRIDDHVKHSAGRYKDRSDFIAIAARHEMAK